MNAGEIFLDSLIDSAKMLPWLFVTYLIIEILERHVGFEKHGKFLGGKAAPVFGGLAGVFPSCGVSVMSAKLYDGGLITVGTLLSVFIATSDEAFSILLASDKRLSLLYLIGLKIVIAVAVGEIADLIVRKKPKVAEDEDFKHEEVCAHCHDHVSEDEKGGFAFCKRYIFIPLLHALQTFLFVFAVTFVFGLFFGDGGIVGKDAFNAYFSGNRYFEPFLTALVGLIPNCASSAVLTAAYVDGIISFGSLAGGLIANAGVGLAILFRNGKQIKRNIIILITLYLIGSVVGLILHFALPAL